MTRPFFYCIFIESFGLVPIKKMCVYKFIIHLFLSPIHYGYLQMKEHSSRYSSEFFYLMIIVLVLSGVVFSGYLAISHYRNYVDISYRSFCAISRSLNCDTVSQSPQSILLNLPLAVWGIIGYLTCFVFVILFRGDKQGNSGWALLSIIAFIFSAFSIYLAAVSIILIHSYCLMCILTYAINFLLLYLFWLAWRRFGEKQILGQFKKDISYLQKRLKLTILLITFLITGVIFVFSLYPNYWKLSDFETDVKMVDRGVSEDGLPWIGAQNPSLTITEFTDYMCFQCGKMHGYLRKLINAYPDKIRLIHRHYPLDNKVNPIMKNDFHENSGLLSAFAILAKKEGKFWKVNDRIFQDARQKKINLSQISKDCGMESSDIEKKINSPDVIKDLEEDIRAGLKLKITTTPSYLINGNVYIGTIPEEILLPVINDKKRETVADK